MPRTFTVDSLVSFGNHLLASHGVDAQVDATDLDKWENPKAEATEEVSKSTGESDLKDQQTPTGESENAGKQDEGEGAE